MVAEGGQVFHNIILITGEAEQPFLGDVLRRHNPTLAIVPVLTPEDLAGLDPALLPDSRLIAFSSNVLVPGAMLAATSWGAYNFHPGPPDHPGWAPAAFAAYNGDPTFGATVHVMTERVDSGPIVAVEMFDVPIGIDQVKLAEMAYSALARLFWQLAGDLATMAAPLPILPMAWGGERHTRGTYARMCDIPPDIADEELARRVRAFGEGDGRSRPTITLHGHRFRLE